MQQRVYPKGLSDSDLAAAVEKLAALPGDLAQQRLDELAGRMEAGTTRVSSLAYLRGLVSRARTGGFAPDAALLIADRRERQQQVKAALRQTAAAHSDVPALSRAGDSPHVCRLDEIRRRSRCGSGNSE